MSYDEDLDLEGLLRGCAEITQIVGPHGTSEDRARRVQSERARQSLEWLEIVRKRLPSRAKEAFEAMKALAPLYTAEALQAFTRAELARRTFEFWQREQRTTNYWDDPEGLRLYREIDKQTESLFTPVIRAAIMTRYEIANELDDILSGEG